MLLAVLAAQGAAGETVPPARPQGFSVAPGRICGDPALAGWRAAPIAEAGGCGIAAPVRVETAAGVTLEPPPVLACGTARALARWLGEDVRPRLAAEGEAVAALTVVDAYSCRNRNRAKDGKLSEHAVGGAIDISAFRMEGGAVVTVLDGWPSTRWGPVLRGLHADACGVFGTVLGPEANRLHADHLHVDMEARGSGAWCE